MTTDAVFSFSVLGCRPFVGVLAALLIACPIIARSDDLESHLQMMLERFRQDYGFPGATAAYVLPDGQVGVAATGLADVESQARMTPASRMLAASIGKTFVGATVVALAREGQLGLDDPVAEWLGGRDWFSRLPNHPTITIRHLLNHSSGLPDHVHDPAFVSAVAERWRGGGNPFPPEALVGFVLDQPPLFEAGQGWAYSDTGYILLGMIVETATGKRYFDDVQERFIVPLGLSQTTPSDKLNLPDLATGYMAADNSFGFPRETTDRASVMVWHPGIEWTGGGYVSTSHDLAVWGDALFGGRALDGPYLDDLLSAVPIDPDNPDIAYGSGVTIYRKGPFGPVYGHGGWIPGYSSSLRYYADHQITVAFQINTDIGIVDDSTRVVQELENELAERIIGSSDAR